MFQRRASRRIGVKVSTCSSTVVMSSSKHVVRRMCTDYIGSWCPWPTYHRTRRRVCPDLRNAPPPFRPASCSSKNRGCSEAANNGTLAMLPSLPRKSTIAHRLGRTSFGQPAVSKSGVIAACREETGHHSAYKTERSRSAVCWYSCTIPDVLLCSNCYLTHEVDQMVQMCY